MTNNLPTSSPANLEDEKATKSLRSLTSIINLAAILGILWGLFTLWRMAVEGFAITLLVASITVFVVAGVLFWCVRLLDQRKKLGFSVYILLIVLNVCVTLGWRMLFAESLFTITTIASLLLPAVIIFELYKLVKKGILT